jgi:hypothetical protein
MHCGALASHGLMEYGDPTQAISSSLCRMDCRENGVKSIV